ncbi:MAG: metallophosphoesterase [Planctomycetota bacterium]
MAQESYRFIHLSDIHFGQEKHGTLVVHKDARDKLIEDCAEFASAHGPADGILVVGDIAYAGKQREYEDAAKWLKAVAQAGGCEEYSVRTIPGNHDIDRTCINVYGRNAHQAIRQATLAQLDGVIEEHLAEAEVGNAMLPKVAAYREFASRFDCDFPSLKHPCWAKEYPLTHQYALRILGMNSVQVCDGSDVKGNMVLGNNQYIIKEKDNIAPIVLIHHPLVWFKDETEAERYLHRAPVLLFGHEHTQGCQRIENQSGQVQVRIFSGAVNPPGASEEFPFQYNWMELSLAGNAESRHLNVALWPRRWHFVQKHFVPDWYSLGEKSFHSFDVPCPKFRPEAPSAPNPGANPCVANSEVNMADNERDFERLKYFFWTHLDWQERVKVLASLDVLPKTITQPQPQTLEHLALKAAQQKGRLRELWEMTMANVPPNEQHPNPFTK